MSAVPLRLRATHTHLYPGAVLRDDGHPLRRGQALRIEFADLGSAAARVQSCSAGRVLLAVDAHRTARGTQVAARRWLIEAGADGEWRVRRRLGADD